MTEAKNWVSVPIWSFARRVDRRGHGASELLSVYRDYGVVPKSSRDDNFNKASEDLDAYQFVQRGDLVLNKMKTWQGSLAVSEFEGIVSPAYFVCKLTNDNHPKFLHYLLRSAPMVAEYGKYSKGIRPNQWDLPFDEFKSIEVKLPPLDEQRRIADFLDDQVTRIDQVISIRKEQKILGAVALQTQMQTLTSRGSDTLWRLGYAFDTGSGTTPNSERAELFNGSIPWVVSGDLNDSTVRITKQCVSSEALTEFSALKVFPPGTVLVAMYGATVGKTGLLGIDACMNQAVCALKERGPVLSQYLQYWLRGHRQSIVELATGGGQPNISQEVVRNLKITTGSVKWQADRVRQMDKSQEAHRHREHAINRSVLLLEERKHALITAAVTGHLDVATTQPLSFSLIPEVKTRIDASTELVTAMTGKCDDPGT
jgi:type I restriction enzyme S subunit